MAGAGRWRAAYRGLARSFVRAWGPVPQHGPAGRRLFGSARSGLRGGTRVGAASGGKESGGKEAAGAHHAVRDRMPEPDRPGRLEATHEEAQQAAVAALGVGAFGGGGALLVDRLGRLAAHPLAPGRHTGSVAVSRRVRVARRIA